MKSKIFSQLVIIVWLLSTQHLHAESFFFYIQFTDKNNTPYSLHRPHEFLSERSINRRSAANIKVDSTDLPVNQAYIEQVLIPGVTLHLRTRWMNGVTVITSDSALLGKIRQLPFVSFAQYTGKTSQFMPQPSARVKLNTEILSYGLGHDQIKQLNGHVLHQEGFTGAGILIGVLDAGFLNTNTSPAFDSLRIQNRLVGAKNFVDRNTDTYTQHQHGTLVLSTMAANMPGLYIGTAPHASYLLIQTEYAPTEYLSEVDFWVAGIEYADSVGVDVVNSSLGYTQFDDESMNYTYADMNGTVSRASRAAAMAARKGILVCNSAGNSGHTMWKYIGAPADADGILAVGAVSSTGTASLFTSFGPSSDGRVKPDVSARGTSTALVSVTGSLTSSSGTSFSSPLIAGLAACLLQYAYNELSIFPGIAAIREAVIASSCHFLYPDERLGYGIPDFGRAMQILRTITQNTTANATEGLSFKTGDNHLIVSANAKNILQQHLKIFCVSGRLIFNLEFLPNENRNIHLNPGIYIYQYSDGIEIKSGKFIIP